MKSEVNIMEPPQSNFKAEEAIDWMQRDQEEPREHVSSLSLSVFFNFFHHHFYVYSA